MSNSMQPRTLWCFARPTPEGWWAFCASLNIAVEGSSYPDSRKRLEEAIREYLKYVHSLPEPDRSRLASRRAPVSVWVKLFTLTLISKMFHGPKGGQHGAVRFTECLGV